MAGWLGWPLGGRNLIQTCKSKAARRGMFIRATSGYVLGGGYTFAGTSGRCGCGNNAKRAVVGGGRVAGLDGF